MSHFRAACVQLTADREDEVSLVQASALIREAHAQGAEYVQTPECTTMMEPDKKRLLAKALPEEKHPSVKAFSALAKELGIWLHIGSLIVGTEEKRAANRAYLFDPTGAIKARYEKIHMFDVDIPDGQTYRESATFRPGEKAGMADLPWGKLGMAICYDLRFPYLFRAQAKAGASILTAPAAFTKFTGAAHWHTLLKARAIENGCFVIAAAQCGVHAEGRETYGHSLIIAPWGEVLADAGSAPGVIVADIDLARVAQARTMVPSIEHDREFSI
ncbi:carbon-nitrogen hydrolase family protein [Kiloniella laminariae]|uniref:Carbon-nitrogen hydrolase family protein n=1 Tax=Kiloniella laminariae TaxID=454162 RepID=A0ABT4LM19_9PROT|nr:carbon-nitrogen hydrolase family protein [Kiloniella laminariae]MCZ4282161.1 carbon-nitrogen hydrolase family protein [Kiloniella laminariae]